MILNQIVIPIKNDEVYEGFAELNGVMKFEKPNLVMEFQTSDSFIGILKSAVKKIIIPISDIGGMEFTKGNIFKAPKLKLSLKSMIYFNDLPYSVSNPLQFKLAKNISEIAASFVSQINLMISEQLIEDLESES